MSVLSESDQSTLKVAYAISALDGTIQDEELRVFRKTAEAFPGFCAGTPTTDSLMVETFTIGNELMMLRRIYSDDELLKALIAKLRHDLNTIKKTSSTTKKAFAIWLAIALADKNASDLDIKMEAIKVLQAMVNSPGAISASALGAVIGASLGATAIGGVCAGSIAGIMKNTTLLDSFQKNQNQIISDSFLQEIKDFYATLAEIKLQMEQCNEARKCELQKTYDEIINCIHETITSEK